MKTKTKLHNSDLIKPNRNCQNNLNTIKPNLLNNIEISVDYNVDYNIDNTELLSDKNKLSSDNKVWKRSNLSTINEKADFIKKLSYDNAINKVYHGDCLKVMDELIKKWIKVDAVITDPPYIISKDSWFSHNSSSNTEYSKKYGKHSIDFWAWDKEPLNLDAIFTKLYKLLKPNGSVIFFYDIWKLQEVKECAESHWFKQPRLGIWIKSNPVPINSKLNYLSNAKEWFISFVKDSKPTFNSEYDNWIYTYPICKGKERTSHTTQKPLKLFNDLISKHTNEWDLILDCFAWSGTTGEACKNLNRNYILIEKEKKYVDIINKRLSLNVNVNIDGDNYKQEEEQIKDNDKDNV